MSVKTSFLSFSSVKLAKGLLVSVSFSRVWVKYSRVLFEFIHSFCFICSNELETVYAVDRVKKTLRPVAECGRVLLVFSLRLNQLGLRPRRIKLPLSGSRGQSLGVNEWRNSTLPSVDHHSAPHPQTKSGDIHYFPLILLNTGKETIIFCPWVIGTELFHREVIFAGTVISEFSRKRIRRLFFLFDRELINGLSITFLFLFCFFFCELDLGFLSQIEVNFMWIKWTLFERLSLMKWTSVKRFTLLTISETGWYLGTD